MPNKKKNGSTDIVDSENGEVVVGRASGFSRLINERTMFQETKPIDEAVEKLCPPVPTEEDIDVFYDKLNHVEFLAKEIISQTKANRFHVTFDDGVLVNVREDAIWQDAFVEVFIPIRAMGIKVLHDIPGYPVIQITQNAKFDDDSFDPFEFIRSCVPKKRSLMSPSSIAKCLHKLVSEIGKSLSDKNADDVHFISASLVDNQNCIDCIFECSENFLSSTHETASAETTVNHCEPDPGIPAQNDSIAENDSLEEIEIKRRKRRSTLRPADFQSAKFRIVRFRLLPAYPYIQKDNLYLTGKPYTFDTKRPEAEVWRISYHYKECAILAKIFRADRGLRLRAWAGVTTLCLGDPDMTLVTRDHIEHCLLHAVEDGIDNIARWQRMSLTECVRALFTELRTACSRRRLGHYLMDDLNLLEGWPAERISRAMVRSSLFVKSDNAVCRAVVAALKHKSKVDAASLHGITPSHQL